MDGIDFDILQKLSIKYKQILLDIFNAMYKNREFPGSWKHSFVLFINKANSESLRPIALTSCLCKLFETLIKNRLQWWVEHNNLIPNSQQGFRTGKSCADNLAILSLKIEEAFSDHRFRKYK